MGFFASIRSRKNRLISEIRESQLIELIGNLEQVAEDAGSPRLLELEMEDLGWTQLGGAANSHETGESLRRAIVRRARRYAIHDPLSVHTIRLWRVFILGRGITVRASSDKAQEVLDAFWGARVNRTVFNMPGLAINTNRLYVDGELPFVLFSGGRGDVTVRRMDPLQITGIVTNPDDSGEVWGYKREFFTKDKHQKKLFYLDMYAPNDVIERAEKSIVGFEPQQARIYFAVTNTLGQRGNSILTSTLDWARAHRKFMEARRAIQAALAEFAWKHKVRGGAGAVAAAIAKMRSGLATGSGVENNPPPAPGSTYVENDSSNLSPIKAETGAAAAQTDGSMLLQMAGVGAGIFPHYYGSGESFRLATATAMELPMLKIFRAEQEFWASVYNDLIQYVFEVAGVLEEERQVDIDFPPIVERDVAEAMDAIFKSVTIVPRLADALEMKTLILTTLGINNPTEVLAGLDDLQKSDDEKPPPGEDQQSAILEAAQSLRNLGARLEETA